MTEASKFYGKTYAEAHQPKKDKLDAAVKYLDMAIRADTEQKQNMAFNAALKNEAEAFAA